LMQMLVLMLEVKQLKLLMKLEDYIDVISVKKNFMDEGFI